MHLEREQVQRALAGELRGDPEQHLEGCPECRANLAEAKREEIWLLAQLAALDHAAPRVTAQSIMTRSGREGRAWGRLAAGVALALAAAGAAYAAPGSPLPGMISRLVHLVVPATRPAQLQPGEPLGSEAGIAVTAGERLTIDFASHVPGDTAVVSLTGGNEVVVKASGGTTSFVSDADRLIVQHGGSPGRFEILVPEDAPLVILVVGNRSLWVKTGSRIDGGGAPGGEGRYLLPLSPKSLP